ncbi:endonuclease [uncultured Polaribacter sp.]|uniref:endonuclease n=1 Tax=uncultured Polaribacter sp. TaxID=174711 RepID=UPI0026335E32|nr:endonuclease [uncultured Polaribacter sp.]
MKLIFNLFFFITTLLTYSQESYYNDVDKTLTGLALKEALATKIIATHTNILEYTSSNADVWDACIATDINPENSNEIILYYGWENVTDTDITNDRTRDINLQDAGGGSAFVWNREHVFPKSLANPVLNTDVPGPATDAHHLRAADRTRNSTRNNRKYGSGIGNSNFSSDTFAGLSGANTNAWYPGDEWKGDAARMIMYMYLRYGDVCLPTAVGVGSTEFTPDDMIDLFLNWNAEDPVSQIEKDRNTYHENTSNFAAQGNRNPFIDNPYLATRIWGGISAEDRWGIYTSSDTEAPSTPTNVTLSNIKLTSIDISWTAATDNIEVSGYNIYVNDILTAQTSNKTNTTITNLKTNTNYTFRVVAKDIINNLSAPSIAINGKTLQDTEAPTIPTNLLISNISDSSFKVSWSVSTDNNAIAGYEIFIDDNLIATTTNIFYTVTGLETSTNYAVQVLAKDVDNNKSAKSTTINVTTTDGTSNGVIELFISEYTEPDGGNNKAIEIVNLSSTTINLSGYSIQKFTSSGWFWTDDLPLDKSDFLVDPSKNSIVPNDVFVIIHAGSAEQELIDNADLKVPSRANAPYKFASPMNFNGDDPIGLFKNGVLIDVIGDVTNTSKHIANKTYRRKSNISVPNSTFTLNEWDVLPKNTFDGIGNHTSTLSTKTNVFESFKMFPNPTNRNRLFFSTTENANITIYTILGKLIQTSKITKSKNNIDISKLPKGVYLLKTASNKQMITKKLIKI